MQLSVGIPGYSESRPTYYTVQVVYGQTSYELKKRYSDFDALDAQLRNEMGERPPADLPPKKWLGASSQEFLHQRRRALEIYIRSICRRDDWCGTLAVQQFLETAKHLRGKTTANSTSQQKAEWIKSVDEARSFIRRATDTTAMTEQRRLVVLASAKVRELEAVLGQAGEASSGSAGISDGEYSRRRDTVQELSRALVGLKQRQLRSNSNSPFEESNEPVAASDSAKLFGSAAATTSKRRVLGGGETDRTRTLNNAQVLQLQQDDMQDQDATLEQLRAAIQRQKQLGLDINEELTLQNELLDQLDSDTHTTAAKLNQARRRVNKFT